MALTVFSPSVLGSSTGTTADAAVAIAEAKLIDTCDIWRKNPDATDDEGGPSTLFPDAWTPIATGAACLLTKPVKQTETVVAGGVTAFSSWTLEVALGTDLQPGDRILKNGMQWDVVDTDLGISNPLLLTAPVTRRNR